MNMGFITSAIIMAFAFNSSFASVQDTTSKQPLPKIYIAAFAGAGYNVNLDAVRPESTLYGVSAVFTPIEYGMLVYSRFGLGINTRFQLGKLGIDRMRMIRRLNHHPPTQYDLKYEISKSGGKFYAMQMGMFYSVGLLKNKIVDLSVMPGGALVFTPSGLVVGWDDEKARYLRTITRREELQPTVSIALTLRQKEILKPHMAVRTEYQYIAETHFIYTTLAILISSY